MLTLLDLGEEEDDCLGVPTVPRARERVEDGPFGGAVLSSADGFVNEDRDKGLVIPRATEVVPSVRRENYLERGVRNQLG